MECCKDCKYCHMTKELINHSWQKYPVCTLWLELTLQGLEEAHEPMLMTVRDHYDSDGCEMWEKAISNMGNMIEFGKYTFKPE